MEQSQAAGKVNLEEGITTIQRSRVVGKKDEFGVEVKEPGIPDDEAKSPISQCLVTTFLSFLVIESLPQGKSIRCKKLSQTLLDDNLDTHGVGAEVGDGQTREGAKEQGLGGQDVCAVTDGRKAEAMTGGRGGGTEGWGREENETKI